RQPRAAAKVDVSVGLEAPAAQPPADPPGGERGLGDRGAVACARPLDRGERGAGRVVGGGRVALGLLAGGRDVALVEHLAGSLQARRRDAAERDRGGLRGGSGVAGERRLETGGG